MPNTNTARACGVNNKFRVTRIDGSSRKGQKHEHCTYFVLDLVHDKYASAALKAYADACEAEYPELALDIRMGIGHMKDAIAVDCQRTREERMEDRYSDFGEYR